MLSFIAMSQISRMSWQRYSWSVYLTPSRILMTFANKTSKVRKFFFKSSKSQVTSFFKSTEWSLHVEKSSLLATASRPKAKTFFTFFSGRLWGLYHKRHKRFPCGFVLLLSFCNSTYSHAGDLCYSLCVYTVNWEE